MILLAMMFLSWNFLCVVVGAVGLGNHEANMKVLFIGGASNMAALAALGLSR